MKMRILIILLALAMVLTFAGCSTATQTPKVKVGFIYIGSKTDGGWSQAHEDGRKALVAKYPNVETLVKENVPETAESEQAMRGLIDQGCNVIFATSFGYQDSVVKMAAQFPNVQFFHATGWKTSANMSQYNGRLYQARFLAGIVAGKKTVAGKIGYVAAFPIPEVIRGINAYAMGAKIANPKATVEVVWTSSWIDASAERAAAETLLNKGCDVVGYQMDMTTPLLAAQAKGVWATGNNLSSVGVADKAYLTAPLMHWGVYYTDAVGRILNNTFKAPDNYWGSMKQGMVSLDKLTAVCAPGTQELVNTYQAKLMSGNWDVFTAETAPIKDQKGTVKCFGLWITS
jgi:basic membrane protein A